MPSKLEITETRDTPYICFDAENKIFEIKGNSLPEDSFKFFEPVFDWINEYAKDPNDSSHIVCKLEYFNSSSAKMLYELFFEFEQISETGKQVKVTWYYEPGDKLIEEKGLEYKSLLEIPFELKELK